jgi:DMSO/TMAO reductase YedYZ molybdopterin-dependent catalytic subunit
LLRDLRNPAAPLIRITSVTLNFRLRARGALAGFLAAGVGVCVGFLAAGVTGSVGSPVVAVAEGMIDLSPAPVKNFAIKQFGSNDKLVLQIGVLIVLALLGILIGMAAMRSINRGLIGFAVLGIVGLIAAATRPTSGPADLVPSLIATAASAFTLVRLTRAAGGAQIATATATATASSWPRPPSGSPGPADSQPPGSADATPPGSADATPPGSLPPGSAARPTTWPPSPAARPAGRLAVSEPPRRQFMQLSAAAVGVAGVAYLGGRLLSERTSVAAAVEHLKLPAATDPAAPLPHGCDLKIPGLASFITQNSAFYRVDTAIVLPQIPPSAWQLRIHGMVSREITLSFGELLKRPLIEDYITLCCVSNPVSGPYISNAKWLGASLGALLRDAGIKAGADQLYCTSFDGFTSGTPVATAMDGRDAMLAVAMNGKPLPTEHGFPVRTVVPGLYGYVSACKWITDIEVTTYAANQAYWAQRGWSQEAVIKTESRIDVPSGQNTLKAGPTTIAGVAWAQHRGIEAVEVRVNGGPWREATLAAVPGIDTWRQWSIPWNATPGSHRIEARATDKTGYTQTALAEPPEPNGATGYPLVSVSVQ